KAGTRTIPDRHEVIAKKSHGRDTSAPKLKLQESKGVLRGGAAAIVLIFAAAYYFLMPVAEVVTVRRGTAISAVYGTVRIEPAARRSGSRADRARPQSQLAGRNNEETRGPDEELRSSRADRRRSHERPDHRWRTGFRRQRAFHRFVAQELRSRRSKRRRCG